MEKGSTLDVIIRLGGNQQLSTNRTNNQPGDPSASLLLTTDQWEGSMMQNVLNTGILNAHASEKGTSPKFWKKQRWSLR